MGSFWKILVFIERSRFGFKLDNISRIIAMRKQFYPNIFVARLTKRCSDTLICLPPFWFAISISKVLELALKKRSDKSKNNFNVSILISQCELCQWWTEHHFYALVCPPLIKFNFQSIYYTNSQNYLEKKQNISASTKCNPVFFPIFLSELYDMFLGIDVEKVFDFNSIKQ